MAVLGVRRTFEGAQAANVVTYPAAGLLLDLLVSRGWGEHPSDAQLAEFGAILARLVNRSRGPWGRSYLSNILAGRVPASVQFLAALQAYGSLEDGAPAELATSVSLSVRVPLGVVVAPGALLLRGSLKCAYIRCGVDFIPVSNRQVYHCDRCRRLAQNLKRKSKGGS